MEKSFTKFWKSSNRSRADVIMHAALKAFFAKSNSASKEEIFRCLISKSFTPITNPNKLVNGSKPFQAYEETIKWMAYTPKVVIFNISNKDAIEHIFDNNDNKYEEFNTFFHMLAKRKFDFTKRYYTYIFVDQEKVEPIYQAVQAAHVAMVIGQKMNKSFNSSNIYFQVCKLPLGTKIENFKSYLLDKGLEIESFYEPDVNRTIAIGTHPIASHKRSSLLTYDRLSF